MHAIQALSVLALAASALAVPHGRRHVVQDVEVVYETVTVVVDGAPEPTPAPYVVEYNPAPAPAPVVYTTVIDAPKVEAEAPPKVEKPAPTPEAPKKPSAPSTNTGYMAVVEEYRGKLGLKSLTQDSTLEGNALKTARDGNGQMVHQLNSGSMGQVLAPGQPDDFVKVFVGGWLCEKPSLPGLDGICSSLSSGWMYTSTGHADILTSTSYSKIGCGCAGGIWACDLA
jgi:hypothetical protein